MKKFFSFLLLTFIFGSSFADNVVIPEGMPGRNRGDILVLTKPMKIAKWCDFSKQMIKVTSEVGDYYICAYVGEN